MVYRGINIKPVAYCLHQELMLPFYNDEFQIVLSLFTFYFEVILKSQESCKNSSTTSAYLHSDSTVVSIWPHLLYHSLSVFVCLAFSIFSLPFKNKSHMIFKLLNAYFSKTRILFYIIKENPSKPGYWHGYSTITLPSNFAQISFHNSNSVIYRKTQTNNPPLFFLFSFWTSINLGSCMGFSCQVSLVSLIWGQFSVLP